MEQHTASKMSKAAYLSSFVEVSYRKTICRDWHSGKIRVESASALNCMMDVSDTESGVLGDSRVEEGSSTVIFKDCNEYRSSKTIQCA